MNEKLEKETTSLPPSYVVMHDKNYENKDGAQYVHGSAGSV
jgi:hypothetical protein